MKTTVTDRLEALIQSEREALMSGDLERIAEILAQKEPLISELLSEPLAAEKIAPIRRDLKRNQELFDHALSGIRAVADRLADLNKARAGLETYDAQGRKSAIVSATRTNLQRKA